MNQARSGGTAFTRVQFLEGIERVECFARAHGVGVERSQRGFYGAGQGCLGHRWGRKEVDLCTSLRMLDRKSVV